MNFEEMSVLLIDTNIKKNVMKTVLIFFIINEK
jgi:hypothetical protein